MEKHYGNRGHVYLAQESEEYLSQDLIQNHLQRQFPLSLFT